MAKQYVPFSESAGKTIERVKYGDRNGEAIVVFIDDCFSCLTVHDGWNYNSVEDGRPYPDCWSPEELSDLGLSLEDIKDD